MQPFKSIIMWNCLLTHNVKFKKSNYKIVDTAQPYFHKKNSYVYRYLDQNVNSGRIMVDFIFFATLHII